MSFRSLFHVHTRHSLDSLLSPAKILAVARRNQIDVLIVTDHETSAGSREVREMTNGNPRFVPLAGEFKTEKGDIIGIFLRGEIHPGSSDEVIRQIRDQGGLVVLPHPARSTRIDEHLLAQVDLIEIHNSRCSHLDNQSAADLATRFGLPFLGGADAHCSGELNGALNHFSAELPQQESDLPGLFLRAPRRIQSQTVSTVYRPYSQMIKAVKTRHPALFLSQSKRLVLTCINELWRQSPP